MVRTLKLTIAYDGTDFAGWQRQPSQRTVQGVLEHALSQITGSPVRTAASGRTDAGVHALGQVVSFDTHSQLAPDVLMRALNARLPQDVVVLDAADVVPGFHATADAIKKRYRYQLHDGPVRDVFQRRYVWHVRYRLDADRMQSAAQGLIGRHDFRSFESKWPNRRTSVRTVFEIEIHRDRDNDPNRITLEIEADGFLYNMVRTITGTLVEVGRGARGTQWPAEVLRAMNRSAAGPTAPPQGLFLLRVHYPSDKLAVSSSAAAVPSSPQRQAKAP